jgi:hypothetical protein
VRGRWWQNNWHTNAWQTDFFCSNVKICFFFRDTKPMFSHISYKASRKVDFSHWFFCLPFYWKTSINTIVFFFFIEKWWKTAWLEFGYILTQIVSEMCVYYVYRLYTGVGKAQTIGPKYSWNKSDIQSMQGNVRRRPKRRRFSNWILMNMLKFPIYSEAYYPLWHIIELKNWRFIQNDPKFKFRIKLNCFWGRF